MPSPKISTANPAKKQKTEKKALRKNPNAPKRFKSSYICFFVAKQDEIKKEIGQDATVSLYMNILIILFQHVQQGNCALQINFLVDLLK